jgi:hypothetical protein
MDVGIFGKGTSAPQRRDPIEIDRNIHHLGNQLRGGETERETERRRDIERRRGMRTAPGYSKDIGGVSLHPPARSILTGEDAKETLDRWRLASLTVGRREKVGVTTESI